ncbi:hypothetical protein [Sphingomonas sp. Leaf4]|uniref:hypothetical protein n=1 Tax=Sphingomonas sp. Leaf4 TaxID=2876553 RepID=UPI001E5F100B|nr:hypothetical protein [Sphingomonas sp. Leaf4]
MKDTFEGMGRIAAGLTFDQAAAAALLGVIVAGIVGWGNSIVTFWGLRRNAAISDAGRRAAVDIRDPSLTSIGTGTDVVLRVVNVGKGVADEVSVAIVDAAGDLVPIAWFFRLGVGEDQMVVHRFDPAVGEVVVAIAYDDGVGKPVDSRTRLKTLASGGTARSRVG